LTSRKDAAYTRLLPAAEVALRVILPPGLWALNDDGWVFDAKLKSKLVAFLQAR